MSSKRKQKEESSKKRKNLRSSQIKFWKSRRSSKNKKRLSKIRQTTKDKKRKQIKLTSKSKISSRVRSSMGLILKKSTSSAALGPKSKKTLSLGSTCSKISSE